MANFLRFVMVVLISLSGMDSHAQQTEIRIIQTHPDLISTEVHFQLGEYELIQSSTSNEQLLKVNGSAPILMKGAPDLPQFSYSIQIPDDHEMEIEVIADNYTEITNVNIPASPGNYYRNDPRITRSYEAVFNRNEFYPTNLASLSQAYIYKSLRGQALHIYPFQYNQQTKTLRVHQSVQLRVKSSGRASTINCLPSNLPISNSKREQGKLKQHFINYSSARNTESISPERIMIITTEAFIPELNTYLSWKRACGFIIDLRTIEQPGNANQLKQFISGAYLQQPFSKLLLIGDYLQVPSIMRFGGASDPSYGYILGDDCYPEIQVGRISAETIPELQTQLNRIMAYEKAIGMHHFDRFAGIASALGPGDNNEYDFEHSRGIGNQLMQADYTHFDELYDGSQGGTDLPGNPSPATLIHALNAGSGLLMYTGHGTRSTLSTTGFGIDDASSLSNQNQLPFVVSVACLNGDFVGGTCLAEALVRTETNSGAVGAVGAYMSSINQSWNPPMSAQDEMARILSGNDPEFHDFSLGTLCELACLKMMDDYGDAGAEMAATWHLFGDPTMNLRTRIPQTLQATFASELPVNSTEIVVQCSTENALVALSQNDELLGAAYVTGGIALIHLDPLASLDSISVCITAQNYYPFVGSIDVIPSEQAHIALTSVIINDSLGNSNGLIDADEHVFLEIHFSNLGMLASNALNLSVTCENTALEFIQSQCSSESLEALSDGQTACIELLISQEIIDYSEVHFLIQFSDNQGNSWSYTHQEKSHAPVIRMQPYQILELDGNFNGRADPSETIQVAIPFFNAGHAPSSPFECHISTESDFIDIQQYATQIPAMDPDSGKNAFVELYIHPEAIRGSFILIHVNFVHAGISTDTLYQLKIGAIIEDAESANFTTFHWDTSHVHSWINDQEMAQFGHASFRSAAIMNGESSELGIHVNVIANDSIRFYYKVSSEFQWDEFQFYIDDELMLHKSAEISWTSVSIPIASGNHLLKWVYVKDAFVSSGFDAAWIDEIEFPAGSEVITAAPYVEDVLHFRMYPNPAKRNIKIVSQNDLINTYFHIYNLQGICIYSEKIMEFNQGVYDLQLPAMLANGYYVLHVGGISHRLLIMN